MVRRGRLPVPRPFLKWAGGKTRLMDRLEPLFPPEPAAGGYIEPFVGSGAVFFRIRRAHGPRHVLLSDGNAELVNAWIAIRDRLGEVIRHLRRHRKSHCREHYYLVRAERPGSLAPAARAARLIYLNRTCYNGLYRVNRRGEFNVPIGRYVNPPILDEENLRAVSALLAGVAIDNADFRDTPGRARQGDFIYFDPPYRPISATSSFTAYTDRSFGDVEQETLAQVCVELDRMDCRFMLSNSDSPFIRGLYESRGFRVFRVEARRSINARADRRGPVDELVVVNYQIEERRVRSAALPEDGRAHRDRSGQPRRQDRRRAQQR